MHRLSLSRYKLQLVISILTMPLPHWRRTDSHHGSATSREWLLHRQARLAVFAATRDPSSSLGLSPSTRRPHAALNYYSLFAIGMLSRGDRTTVVGTAVDAVVP